MAREAIRPRRPSTPSGPRIRPPKNRRVARAASAPARASLRQRTSRLRAELGRRLGQAGRRLRGPGVLVLRVLGIVALAGGAVALGRLLQHHLTTAPAFAVETIDVQGLSRMDREELLEAAGIEPGTNVFARSPDEIRASLLSHPWIASARVTRRLPGRFDIEVRERQAAALLVVEPCARADSDDAACDDGSSLYLVSDEGKLFKRLEAEDPVDLPVITGIDRARFGADAAFRERVLLSAVSLVNDYRSVGLWERLPVAEIHVEANEGFSLYVGEELTLVRLGVSPFEQKLKRMKKVFERLRREQATAEYVYLDNEAHPDRVTVRLR